MLNNKKSFLSILKGSIIAIAITLFSMFIVSVIFTLTNISEAFIPQIIIAVTSISILIGSIIASINIGKMGILNGALVGFIYLFTIYLLSSIIVCGFSFNVKSLIMIVISIVLGIIGGIIGVNFSKK